ncbi:MAG: stalk domain-containing protein [archaeon]
MKKVHITILLIMFVSSIIILPLICNVKYFVKSEEGYRWVKTNNGLFGGDVHCISIDPTNNNLIYAGTDNGIYKSTDGGITWVSTVLTNHSIYSIKIDPTDTKVLYAAADDGIYLGINYGIDWLNIGQSTGRITSIDLDPLNSKNIYAALCGGIYVKKGTEQWVNISNNLTNKCINTVVINPTNPDIIFVGTSNTFNSQGQWIWGGLFVTKNGGTSWTQIAKDSLECSVFSIVFQPNNSNIIYVGAEDGVFKSIDGGVTFSKMNNGLKFDSDDISNTMVYSIAISPHNNQIVYAGSNKGLFKSANGGLDWVKVDLGLENNSIKCLAINSQNPEAIYAGTNGRGVIKSVDGIKWTLFNDGIDAVQIDSLSIDPNNASNIFAGTEGNGLFRSSDGGRNWMPINTGLNLGTDNKNPFPLCINSIAIDNKNSQIVYLGTNKGIFKSVNGGDSWIEKNSGLSEHFVYTVLISSFDSRVIYAGTADFLFKSTDGGESWVHLNSSGISKQYSGNIAVHSIAIDLNNAQAIYAGTDEGLLKSMDNGTSWTRLSLGSSVDSVYCVTVSASSPNIIYANTSTFIFKSSDGGSSWKKLPDFANISGFSDIFINSILVDPKNSNNLYLATNLGIFQSKDGGNNWVNFGLQPSVINAIVLSQNPYKIYVGTGNNGVYAYLPMDTEAPTIKISSPLDGCKVYQKTVQISGSVTDNIGVTSLFIGSTKVSFAPDGTFAVNVELSEGENLIEVRAFDAAGNMSVRRITVVYEKKIYTITASASPGGSISPSGTVAVNYGDSKTFTITPNSGYKISNVKVDGVSVGVVSSYTFSNITSDHKIEATFEKQITQTVIILKIGSSSFTVNGETKYLDSPPIIKNNRTLLPIRPIIESLGGSISWDPTLKKVEIFLGTNHLILQIGNANAYVNGSQKLIDTNNPSVYPEIINGRTMLPLRFVAENLGCSVEWDGTTKTITITYGG